MALPHATSIDVLIVDPDVAYTDNARECLDRYGEVIDVKYASKIEEALTSFETKDFDCILMSHQPPALDAIEGVSLVRDHDITIPIIIQSMNPSEDIAAEAFQAGASDVVEKRTAPESWLILANRIETLVIRHRCQEEIVVEGERLRRVIETSPAPIILLDAGGNMILLNGAATELVGAADAEEFLGTSVFEFIHPEEREESKARIRRVIEQRESIPKQQRRIIATDGNVKTTMVSAVPIVYEGETAALATAFDVTELLGMRNRLAHEQQFIETALNALPDIFFLLDSDLHLQRWNQRLPEVSGYTDEELDGMDVRTLIPKENEELLETTVNQALETGTSRVVMDLVTKSGERIPHEAVGTVLTDEAGNVIGFVGIERDVSEQLRTQQRLEASERRFSTVFEKAFDGLILADDEGQISAANPAAGKLFGLAPNELVGQFITDFAIDEDDFLDEWNHFKQDKEDITHGLFKVQTADGKRRSIEFGATRDILPEQHLAVCRDVTERLERERELTRQNERLKEFASIISHDLRNPLNVATGFLDIAREDGSADAFDRVERSLDRMETLINDLLSLARQGELVAEMEPVSLPEHVKAVWETVEQASATLNVDTEATIMADESRLRQVFENLIKNAIQHGGSDVTVTVGDCQDGFFVEDDGSGIPEHKWEEVFDYGYTSSEEGTGFGLAIIEQIVTAHGWDITLTEASTGGARFEITNVTRVSSVHA